jgi:hypothetical protein
VSTSLTALNILNRALRDAGEITSDLTSFTDTSRQAMVDRAIEAMNEVHDELQDLMALLPQADSEGTLTLVTNQREYTVGATFGQMADDVMRDTTTGFRLFPYHGGYEQLILDQPIPGDNKGSPNFWVFNPTNGKFRLDNSPTAGENGRAYTYLFEKDTRLSAVTDKFVFNDKAMNRAIPAIVQVWKRKSDRDFDEVAYNKSLARAASIINPMPADNSYGPPKE